MSLKEKPTRGIFWSFLETFGVRACSVSTYFILAKLLDPSDFGLVALTNTFIFFSEIFVEQGIIVALVQKKKLDAEYLSSAFWGNIGMGLMLFAVIFFSAPHLAILFNEALLIDILRIHAFTFILSSFAKVHLALLQRKFKFKEIAISRTTAIIVSCFFSIIMAYKGFGVWSMVFQQIIFVFLQSLSVWFFEKWKPNLFFSWNCYKVVFKFGCKVMLNQLINYFIRFSDTLLIGYFLGIVVLGYYSFAQKIFITLTDLIDLTFSKITLSVFSSLQDNKILLAKELNKFINYLGYISFPLFAATIVFSPILIPLLFGQKWSISVQIIQIISVAGAFICFYLCFNNFFLSVGKVEASIKIRTLHLVANLLLFTISAQYNVTLIATVHIITSFVLVPFVIREINKIIVFDIKRYILDLRKPFFASCLIALFVKLSLEILDETNYYSIMSIIICSVAIYVLFVLKVNPHFLNILKFSKYQNLKKIK